MEDVRRFIQENDTFAQHLGIELTSIGKGEATARMPLDKRHKNGLGMAHGGAVFALADLAFAAASNSHGRAAVAVNATVSYLKPGGGTSLTAKAREVSLGHKIGNYEVEISDDHDQVVAVFQGTVYRKSMAVPPNRQTSTDSIEDQA